MITTLQRLNDPTEVLSIGLVGNTERTCFVAECPPVSGAKQACTYSMVECP